MIRYKKKPPAAHFAVAVIIAAALLVGCSRSGSAQPPIQSPRLVEANLTWSGGPLTAAGALEPMSYALEVRDHDSAVVTFNEEFIADADGEIQRILMEPGASTLVLAIPEGSTYAFELYAFDAQDNLVAYGFAQRIAVAGGSNATRIDLHGLLGEAQLFPRLPTNQLQPGQELDLLLAVSIDSRTELSVALSDFDATYLTSNGTSLAFSNRGVSVRAGDRTGGDLVVDATLSGQVTTATGVGSGEIHTAIRIPFSTSLSVDLEPPTLETLAFDAVQQIFTGVADDNFGIARLEIYDGPRLLATSDAAGAADQVLPIVVFPGGGTAFWTQLSLPVGDHSLTAIATDTSEQQAQAHLEVEVK